MSRAVRLSLLCHGATTLRPASFAADAPLADGEAGKAARLASLFRGPDRVLASPARAARGTVEALGFDYGVDAAFRDLDLGRWAGQPVAEVAADEPDKLAAWSSDPDAAPHGGESLTQLIARAGRWLETNISTGGLHLVVTHPSVVRAMIVHALDAPAAAWWKIDAEPLSLTELSSDGRRWAIRSMGRALQ